MSNTIASAIALQLFRVVSGCAPAQRMEVIAHPKSLSPSRNTVMSRSAVPGLSISLSLRLAVDGSVSSSPRGQRWLHHQDRPAPQEGCR
jgi:hypothetical protein